MATTTQNPVFTNESAIGSAILIPLGFNLRQRMGELSRNPASRYSTDFHRIAK
jgi:hypothetical protein